MSMNGGDAFEQTMKIVYQGTEITIKLVGQSAEKLAVLIAALLSKNQNKPTIGKTKLIKLLQDGQPLKVMTLKETDLNRFASLAKKYGVSFSPVKDIARNDGMLEVLVKETDSDRLSIIQELLVKNQLGADEKNAQGAQPKIVSDEQSLNSSELRNGNKKTEKKKNKEITSLPIPPTPGESAATTRIKVDSIAPPLHPAGEAERLALPADNNVVQVYIADNDTKELVPYSPQMLKDFQNRALNSKKERLEKMPVRERIAVAKQELAKSSKPKQQSQNKQKSGKKSKGR